MLDVLKKHKVPVAVTAVGLIVAFALGVVPLVNWEAEEDPKPVATAASAEPSPAAGTSPTIDLSALETRVAILESSTNRRLDGLDLQIKNLNTAAGRLTARINKLETVEQAELPTDAISSLNAQAKSFDAQLINLNKAVTRLHGRYRTVQSETADQTRRINEFAKVSEGLKDIFNSGSNAN